MRSHSEDDAYFLLAALRHRVSTLQLMQFSSGSMYPAIEESSLLQVLIPGAEAEVRSPIGRREAQRTLLLQRATCLVEEAKGDVVALIEGTLDTQAIITGRLVPPSQEVPESVATTA